MSPSVCVGVATYNNQPHIRECLDSILAQDVPRLRVVVSDDASSDATPEILADYARRYPDRMTVLLNPRNLGVSGNVNRILEQVDDDYFCYLPGDDVMYAGKVARSIAFLESNPDVGLGCHDCELFVDVTDRLLYRYSDRFPMRDGGLKDYILGSAYYSFNTVTFRRNTLPEPRTFDDRMGPYSDWEYLARAIARAEQLGFRRPVGFIPDVLVGYRRHAHNLSNRQDRRVLDLQAIGFETVAQAYPAMRPYCRSAERERMLVQALRRGGSWNERLALVTGAISDPRALWMFARALLNILRAHYLARMVNGMYQRVRLPTARPSR
ncbi:MAG: glycosyltransferase [Solirubrobacterales bacterium]